MIFLESPRVKGYVETSRSIVLDYDVKITPLRQVDRVLSYGSLGNYSLAGFEMILHRYVSHYIITYYLPSGEKEFDQVTNPLPPLSRPPPAPNAKRLQDAPLKNEALLV